MREHTGKIEEDQRDLGNEGNENNGGWKRKQ